MDKDGIIQKIDLDELINDYKVINVEAFSTYLKQVWKDLTGRSDQKNKGVNKITFAKYYELPGIISERLFSSFDEDHNKYLDCNEFVKGMNILFSGDFDILIKFIFGLYDFDKDNEITKEDVRIVLSYVPLNSKKSLKQLKFEKESFDDRIESQEELHNKLDKIFNEKTSLNETEFKSLVEHNNSDLFLYILIFLLEKRPFNSNTIKLLESIKKSPQIDRAKSPSRLIASPNVDSKFQPVKTISKSPRYKTNSLGSEFNQASDLLKRAAGKSMITPTTLNYELKLPEKNSDKNKETAHNTKTPTRKSLRQIHNLDKTIEKKKYDGNDDIPLQLARPFEDQHPHEDIQSSEDEKEEQLVEGYLFKIHENKMKKIYFKLICKDMYYYKLKEDEKHKGMHNLSGVYVNEEEPMTVNKRQLYCFSVCFPKKIRKYYCENVKEYKVWIDKLRAAVGYENLGDLYEIKEVLGKGKFGLVRLGIHKESSRKVAIKIINKKAMSLIDLQQVKTEIEILKIAQHPNIIRLYDVFENEEYIYIIMEFCAGGDLFSYIENRGFQLQEELAAKIIHKLSTAIFYLHEYGIIHRDLKPENILMTDDSDTADIRLLDFGLGKMLGPNESCRDPFGTLSYVAPEVLLEKPYNNKVDLWAIGIISYLLVAGFLPFDDETSEKEIARQTVYDPVPYPFIIWKIISLEAKMFINNLLSKEPEKRMTIREVLEHKWLQNFYGKQDTELKRRKSKDLTGAEAFKFYSIADPKNNQP